jgi:Tol biopolymer transport system component
MVVVPLLCFGLLFGTKQVEARRAVKLASFENAHCSHPKWSPNGLKISYEVRNTKKSTIMLHIRTMSTGKVSIVSPAALQSGGFNLGGGNSKRGMVAQELAWSPNSRKYLFSSNGTGTVFNIYLSGEGILKCNSRTKLDGQPAWNKNGKYIAFTSARTGKGDLYYARMTGKNLKAKRLTRFGSSTELFPVWSPAKPLSLAYLRHRDQSDRIYVIKNVFVKKSFRLTKWGAKFRGVSELNPSWSPDGSKIAFFGVYPDGHYDLFVVNATPGSRPKRLAKNVIKSDQYGPTWSPNGKSIFFVKKLSKNRDVIKVVNAASGSAKTIKSGTVNNNELTVVKRGGAWWLAFTAQGRVGSSNQNYRKLYALKLSPM